MKKLKQSVKLLDTLERITVCEFRKNPGEAFAQVELGKTYIISRNGKEIAVLSALPGTELSLIFKRDGSKEYTL